MEYTLPLFGMRRFSASITNSPTFWGMGMEKRWSRDAHGWGGRCGHVRYARGTIQCLLWLDRLPCLPSHHHNNLPTSLPSSPSPPPPQLLPTYDTPPLPTPTDRVEKELVNTFPHGKDQLGGASVDGVATSHHLGALLQDVTAAWGL